MKAWFQGLWQQPRPNRAMLIEGLKRAIITYSRLPIKHGWQAATPHVQPVAMLPIVGAIVALLSAWPLLFSLSPSISALLILLSCVLLTGAFHEDGFMDALDGLVGGWTPEQRLSIMKDSRLGSYAAMGIWFNLTLKWLLLTQLLSLPLGSWMLMSLWVFVHILARITPILLMHRLPYVSLGQSKAKDMIAKLTPFECVIVASPVVLVSSALFAWHIGTFLCVLVGVLAAALGRYFKAKINGFNGDTLGASEQLAELLLLFSLVIYFG